MHFHKTSICTGVEIAVLALLASLVCCQTASAQRTKELQHLWEIDPPLGDVWTTVYAPAPVSIQLEDLNSPFAETRLGVAEQIVEQNENPNLGDKQIIIDALIAKLKSGEENVQVRRAILSATLLLCDEKLAPKLWEFAQTDDVSRAKIEQALIKWKSPVAIEVWRQRLTNPEQATIDLLLAIDGVGVVGSEEDASSLEKLLVDHRLSIASKFRIAWAIGQVAKEGRNDLAQQLLDSNADQRHLLAAHMLSRHKGPRTAEQLKRIVDEGPQSAQAVAYLSLSTVDHPAALTYARQMLTCSDNQLRKTAVDVINKILTPDYLQLQSIGLADRHPEIRQLVTKNLLQAAVTGERSTVDEIVTKNLDSNEWTAVEQSIMLAVRLQDASRCEKLLELLDHPRPEVNMRAGWGLMEIGNEPEILARMQQHVEKVTELLYAGGPYGVTDLIRISYLSEGFGRTLYRPANDLLLKYVAKDNFRLGLVSRASAIWALGKLNTNVDNTSLRERLHERIQDVNPPMPEEYLVRFACVLACGEMAQPDTEAVIKEFAGDRPDPMSSASKWAIERIRRSSATK